MSALDWLGDELHRLERDGLMRTPRAPIAEAGPVVELDGRRLLNLCSNDYLSLAGAHGPAGCSGAGASRLIVGDLAEHGALEGALADWLRVEATLLFTSGYAANVGAIAALADASSLVVSDALNHASIVDGCRLSRARVVVAPHRDVAAVDRALSEAREPRRLVITDGYFSMDATRADLAGLREVCDRHGAALMVDEAHGLGVWGPQGRGVSASVGVTPDVLVGTLGKAFGAAGAFVAGSAQLRRWLWNRARSFVFSTGLAPSAVRSALAALPVVVEGSRTRRVLASAELVRSLLGLPRSDGPIIPVVVGEPARTVEASRRLVERGLLVQAIRPPTVPRGTSRLRITVQSGHDTTDLERAALTVREVLA